jgi:methionyl aminopeptidase
VSIIIKNPEQIYGIRKSSQLAALTLQFAGSLVKQGVTTAFIDAEVEKFMRDNGAIPATKGYRGYKHASCISVNDVICHGIPGPYELKDGDILNIDVTTILNGFYGDNSAMFTVGEVSPYAQKLIDVTRECLEIGIKECYPGNYLGNIGYQINKLAVANGYSVVYEFCGHGVGVKFHEEPEVSHIAPINSGPKLKAGMTFTIEPMINAGKARAKVDKRDGWTARTIDGKLSAQFEHTVLVTDTGVEILTQVPQV